MANYKVVDADKLDSDLKGFADKLRAKTNTEEEISFPEGFDAALDNVGEDLNTEITEQEALIAELKETLAGKAKPVSPKEKDVNFYDYDGTLLHSFTVAEAQALSALPELPTQEGLICQGWNYDLATIKEYNRAVDVGATYITDDGKTRLYIKIATEGRMDVPILFTVTNALSDGNGVTIDWGDGSATELVKNGGVINKTHTYASIGEYMITLDVADGWEMILGSNSSSYCVMGSTGNNGKVYCNMLQKAEIGKGITSIRGSAFYYCYSLANIVIPNGVTSISTYAFNNCYSLASIVIPDGVTSIGGNAFNNCYSLANIVIPQGVTSIIVNAFNNCYSLANIVIPDGVTNIGANTFYSCNGMKYYDFTRHTAVPTLSATSAFTGIPSDCEIRVPAALYDEWIAATNWSTYADYIVAV